MQDNAEPVSQMAGFTYPKKDKTKMQTPLTAEEEFDAEAVAAGKAVEEAAETKKSPAMRYLERLEREEINLSDALKIIDELVVNGRYTEEEKLSASVTVRFCTRSTRFNSYLADKIDIADPKKVGKLNQLMTEYQLSASLERYGSLDLAVLDEGAPQAIWEKALNDRLNFVRRFPAAVFVTLCSKLSRFDSKMIVVFSEGYEQNF